jgi:hypothetical protein
MVISEQVETIKVTILPDGRMDTDNAAKYIGRTPKTMAMWRSQGKGPPYIRRGRIYYYRLDLDEWLADGRATSTAQANLLERNRGQSATLPSKNGHNV